MPISPLVVRRAGSQDAQALADLATNTFRDTYRSVADPQAIEDYVAESFQPTAVAAHIVDPASTILLAVDGSRLVGYAHLRATEPPACVRGPSPIELGRLYLDRGAIGKGNGAKLMRAVHAEARRLGRKTIWLGVYDGNLRAIEFYERFGFVNVGRREFAFGGRIYVDPVMAASLSEDR